METRRVERILRDFLAARRQILAFLTILHKNPDAEAFERTDKIGVDAPTSERFPPSVSSPTRQFILPIFVILPTRRPRWLLIVVNS
ncbi:MAG: hypothetical protein IJE77_09180 [Thermoguttaceae bacterium]|nr:hypothetical protein [Thermoguttaceae bacterium]